MLNITTDSFFSGAIFSLFLSFCVSFAAWFLSSCHLCGIFEAFLAWNGNNEELLLCMLLLCWRCLYIKMFYRLRWWWWFNEITLLKFYYTLRVWWDLNQLIWNEHTHTHTQFACRTCSSPAPVRPSIFKMRNRAQIIIMIIHKFVIKWNFVRWNWHHIDKIVY